MILSRWDVGRVPVGQDRHPGVVFRRFLGNQPLEAGAADKGRNSILPAQHEKTEAIPPWGCRGRFSADSQHPPAPNHGGKRMIHAQSRSPDLRLADPSRPSQEKLPMIDFRHVTGLRAYSGGTVPDSHRIHYSPGLPNGMTPALQRILMD